MDQARPSPSTGSPFAAEIDAERDGWYEVAGLVRSLSPEECLLPGVLHGPRLDGP